MSTYIEKYRTQIFEVKYGNIIIKYNINNTITIGSSTKTTFSFSSKEPIERANYTYTIKGKCIKRLGNENFKDDTRIPGIAFEYIDKNGLYQNFLIMIKQNGELVTIGENDDTMTNFRYIYTNYGGSINNETLYGYKVRRFIKKINGLKDEYEQLITIDDNGEICSYSKPYTSIIYYDQKGYIEATSFFDRDIISKDGELQLENALYINQKGIVEDLTSKKIIFNAILNTEQEVAFMLDSATGKIISYLDNGKLVAPSQIIIDAIGIHGREKRKEKSKVIRFPNRK